MVESGQLKSQNNSFIKAPGSWRMEYQIARLPREGQFVQAGDTVVYFNTAKSRSMMDEALSELELQQEKYHQTEQQNRVDLRRIKDNLQQLKWQLKIDKGKLQQSRFESDIRQRQAELDLKKTELRLQKTVEELKSQKIINRRKLDLVQIAIRQARVKIARARSMLKQMYLLAPRDGMVIYKSSGWGSNEKVRVGDAVWPQTTILSIPDLARMQVLIRLNEVDRPLVKIGQKCDVRINAYPDTVFTGRIESISKIINNADALNRSKTYDVIVALPTGVDIRLKPGLSARVRIHLKKLSDTWQIPEWCLGHDDNGYFVRDSQGRKIDVTLMDLHDGQAFVRGKLSAAMRLLNI